MNKITNHLEANIKREITKLWKENFGKGPEETTVTIFNNIVVIRLDGGIAPIEQMLLSTLEGKKMVHAIMDELILNQTSAYMPTIEAIVKTKQEQISYVLVDKTNSIYLFIVFQKNIETDQDLISKSR